MKLCIFLLTLLSSSSGFAADGNIRSRCLEDTIAATDSRIDGRLGWFAKCFPDEIARHSFGANIEEKKKNWLNEKLYYMGNPANGRRHVIRFPIFTNAANEVWRAPYDVNAACGVPAGFANTIDCESGCYARGMRLVFEGGMIPIEEAMHSQARIMTLTSDSYLDDFTFQFLPIDEFTADNNPAQYIMVRLETKSGGVLVLTHNHPILTFDGYMREAGNLSTKMSLIRDDGSFDPIIAIDKDFDYFGKVYNVGPRVTEENPYENVVVAEGFLNGSSWYQNEGLRKYNRQLLRRRPVDWLR